MQKDIERVITAAQELIKQRYQKDGHHFVVAAAILTHNGHIYTGLNLGTTQPSIAVCAETSAIARAVMAEEDMKIKLIAVARDKDAYLVSPCGRCREFIADYGDKDTLVVVPADNKKGYDVHKIGELLPIKYEKKCQ
ncbi:MAG: cytidine deaminase [Alphaproteobacteria bacterium]|nr:cytidine deaminase [Alphaproteobacteria bacterium]